jgi:hypothetical protein
MISTLDIQSPDSRERSAVLSLVQTAVDAEIRRLELAIELARERCAVFEARHGYSSERFIMERTAEDIAGGDDEYVEWAGEYKLKQRLEAHRERLRGVQYANF